jgi:hypothetical protein
MKNILICFMFIAPLFSSCVDDYDEANPAPQLDGPAPFISLIGDEVESTDDDDDTFTYVPNGGSARIEVDIVDAPGLIDSVAVSLSNIQIPGSWGSISIEGFDALIGQSTGSFVVVYTAPTLDVDSPFLFANEDVVITVYDGQDPAKQINITEVETFKTQLSQGSDCFANISLVGNYNAITSGFDSETGLNYTDLEYTPADGFRVYMLKSHLNNPGWLRMTDGSFGLYASQGFGGNFINWEVCGNSVVNANEEFTDSFSGTIDDATGVITIQWSNIWGDSGNTVLTPVVE